MDEKVSNQLHHLGTKTSLSVLNMEADINYEEADKGPNFGIFKEHFDLASTKQFKATSEKFTI